MPLDQLCISHWRILSEPMNRIYGECLYNGRQELFYAYLCANVCFGALFYPTDTVHSRDGSWGRWAHYCYVMSCLIWAWNFDGFTHLTVASKNQWQIWCTTDLVTRQVLCNVAGDLYRRITNCIVGTNWMVNFSNYVRKLDPFDFKSSCLYTLYIIAFGNIIHGYYHTLCQPSVIMRNSIRGPATKQAISIPTLPKCMCDCCGFHGRRCAGK